MFVISLSETKTIFHLTKKFWIVNKINPTTAEILLYGYISQWDISSADFIIELSQLAAIYSDIKIRINSGGGSVFEGIAIYNSIKSMQRKGIKIATCVDGVAASMAAVIAEAGSPVQISKYGRMMTHRAKGVGEGDADDIRQQAQLVEDAENDLAKIFAEKTGLTPEEVKSKFMQKGVDNWMNAAQCIEYGFADSTYDSEAVAIPENVTEEKDVYNIFETCLNKINDTSQQKKYTMKKELLKKMNLPDNASDEQIDEAVEKVLTDKDNAEGSLKNSAKERAKSLVQAAITNNLLQEADRSEFEKAAEENYDFTEKAINKLKPVKKPSEIISRKDNKAGGEQSSEEKGSDWDALVKQGPEAVAKLKSENPSEYEKIYKTHFGIELPMQ
jgi:ATP-dependent Clp endopeptidase proteolytic subunit ClpP